jgi:antitoxin component YwqK of YwqJK toxin-antitoxin module
MKLTILIILFSTISGFSQEIKFNLFLKDSCSNKIERSFHYHLEKNGTVYNISDFDNGIILPTKGEYKLIATEIGETHKILIDKLINSDTLIKPRIEEYIIKTNFSFKKGTSKEQLKKLGVIPNYKFMNCEKTCNGIETDYHSNGTIRLTGEFKNGLVIGELKRYYQNGNIKEVSVYDKDGILTKTTLFYENGEIKKE